MKCYFYALLAMLICAGGVSGKTLRIVSYNIDCADQSSDNNLTNLSFNLPTVVQAIGLHHLGTNTQPVDVISCEELNSSTLSNFCSRLNAIYGAGTYAYDTNKDLTTGGGTDGIVYRTNSVFIVSGRSLPTGPNVLLQSNLTYAAAYNVGGGVNGITRGPMLYQIRPTGFGTNNDFYFYVSHARSGTDNSVGDGRYAEAQAVRSDAKYKLPAGAHIIYGGDWNLFNGSGENAYKCLTGQITSDGTNWSDISSVWANTNQTQGYDPMSSTILPTTVTWANLAGDHASYLYNDNTSNLTSRIDIQLPNALMYAVYNSKGGVQLAPDTADPYDVSNFPASQYPYAFETFGNDGSLTRNTSDNNASNHALNDLTNTVPNDVTVYAAIKLTGSGATFTGSDHYPIFGDYNIVVNPPVLGQPVVLTNKIQFTISSGSGGSYVIQSSTNLTSTNWITLLTTNPASLPFTFTDTNRLPFRFYRVQNP